MCSSPSVVVMKSNSTGKLLNNEMTLIPAEEPSKLKRTFTLPRNPLRLAKKRSADEDSKGKRVFRRPSFRNFINRIAQHIGAVPVLPNDNNRVPPVGLQTWNPEDTPGVTGLKNHGNTCFINAVLQCISHTDVLAEYFVLDRYKIDLSKRNKLNSKKFGTKGEVTEQLAVILKALWACQYSPELSTNFKQVVERHGAQYKGNQQHDALEFLQWLLDKVHEDLNTASKRKYKSIKTSGRPDEVIAAETLENYKRCNNSFIQGVFQAQYRSSLSCSRCRTQSNTFDPFQCISVQLPQFHKQSIFVNVLYTSQQPRQVQIGLSVPSGATISELRDILESDTSIKRANMLITEIGETGFLRTFTDTQSINIISEIDQIYCIEVAQLKDIEDDATSAYILICWINILISNDDGGKCKKFGSPYIMQVPRETSYDDLQKLILKEMASILHDDVLTCSQPRNIFKMRISDPACNDNEPGCYLEPELEHPLFMEAIDQSLALCSEEGGPQHIKLILEFTEQTKLLIIADDTDLIEEHFSVKQLKEQSLNGGIPLTLEECLRDYTEAETLTDAWRCPHCQQYQPVVKTLDVWSLPDILVVHFKRFRQQAVRGGNSAKLTTMVDFPVENFDMTPHLANNKINQQQQQQQQNDEQFNWSPWKRGATSATYKKQQQQQHQQTTTTNDNNIFDLYGICYHHGSDLETGHYTAACKNPYDNNWYLYDDAKVTNLTKTDDINKLLVNNSAYILFYQRKNGSYLNCQSTNSSGSNSNNSSSAASTSSVMSTINNDHWIGKMPKFQPPKHIQVEKKTENDNKNVVELRNTENTLQNNNNNNNENSNETNSEEKNKFYTTSIYINSSGGVDIETKFDDNTANDNLSIIDNLNNDDNVVDNIPLNVDKGNRQFFTTNAVITRFSDSYNGITRTQLNWMSPQPERKLHQSHQSM